MRIIQMQTKLNETMVVDIRNLHTTGMTQVKIAELFTISTRTVRHVINKTRWTNVPDMVTVFNNYVLSHDGRLWSKNTQKYITTKGGKAKISLNGKSKVVDLSKLMKKYF